MEGGRVTGGLKLKRYLGDGVYAGFDGYQIWVWAERDGREHAIALDAQTMAALKKYAADLGTASSADLNQEQI
jgi:hypothetical protein